MQVGMARHTPAPWVASGREVLSREGRPVAIVAIEADAERIAACVSACKGVPTAELQAGIIRDLIDCCEQIPDNPRLRAILHRMTKR
jgi:hypothetical protein